MAQAFIIEDTKAGLELRNFYFNRDFRENLNTENSKAEAWAQGFLLFRVESGYTEGTCRFGVDALGLVGVKPRLWRRTYRHWPAAAGLGKPADDYSSLGLAAKFKVSETVLKVGTA